MKFPRLRISHKSKKYIIVLLRRFGKWLPDNIYIRLLYNIHLNKWPNLRTPLTFNDKLQWLKLHNHKPEYTIMVDKIEVKRLVAEKIGSSYVIPTIEIWDKIEDINFNTLPEQFVIKTNHDSGGIIVCKDKTMLDKKSTLEKIAKSMKRDYYLSGREWPYKNVNRKIFAEKYVVDESGYELKDYKIFCFGGVPYFIQVDFDRFAESGHKRNIYNINWTLLDFQYGYPSDSSHSIDRPEALDEMLKLATVLSEGTIFLRVDFYLVDRRPLFGELTFYPECGFGKFYPEEWDRILGDLINLE